MTPLFPTLKKWNYWDQVELLELPLESWNGGQFADDGSGVVYLDQNPIFVHVYQLNEEEVAEEVLEGGEDDQEGLPACLEWTLPSRDLRGLWKSLVFDEPIQDRLLDYAATGMLFSAKGVDATIISWNRVILLHGPPGSGKTTLSKALAQKISIRLGSTWVLQGGKVRSGSQINAHSLFSKWFSESGKLVMKLFGKIRDLVEDPKSMVCVLIGVCSWQREKREDVLVAECADEIESLTAARSAAVAGTEPSDAIRVVNAVLTQLDSLKKFNNVLVFATSNITGAIDAAFLDRADIKQYLGPPGVLARFNILKSGIVELMRVGIVHPPVDIEAWTTASQMGAEVDAELGVSRMLAEVARKAQGLSGRRLRKIPFLAHAMFSGKARTPLQFVKSMEEVLGQEMGGKIDE